MNLILNLQNFKIIIICSLMLHKFRLKGRAFLLISYLFSILMIVVTWSNLYFCFGYTLVTPRLNLPQ